MGFINCHVVCDLSDDCGFLDCVAMGYRELANISLVCVLFDITSAASRNGTGNGPRARLESLNCFHGPYNVSLEQNLTNPRNDNEISSTFFSKSGFLY